ncbi:ATP-binding protein [Yoonia sp. 2307UL14-13]|uniref:ATP-binding protein n=1 Tax=Yoonia sp. 2307UL14-13 TaxID=3126506 RepID=UPI0030A43A10
MPLIVAAALPLGLSVIASPPSVRFGLIGLGVVTMLVGIAMLTRRSQARASQATILTSASRLFAAEPDAVFLVDRDDRVIDANPAATAAFGESAGRFIPDILGSVMADPGGLIRRLDHVRSVGTAAKEDVSTLTGRFRLSVTPLEKDLWAWRFDDLSTIDHGQIDGNSGACPPRLHVSPAGIITGINGPARQLLGRLPRKVDELTDGAPLRTGQVQEIVTESGKTSVLMLRVDRPGGQHDIYLLPDATTNGPPKVSAGWDAIEDLPVPLMQIARDGVVLASNREARQLLKIDSSDGKRVADLLDGLGRPINDWLREAAEGRGHHISQFLRGRGDNQDTFVQVTLNMSSDPVDAHLIAVLNDVTELKTLEAQFVQSQKMQAIGQLAGGVAHDFNNLLTAISGHCDLLLLRHDEGDQNYSDLIQIHQNANRAASLVGQLLAFSRKQNLQPEIIDLRDTLSDLTHLLNRLVGEKVMLSLHHDPALAQIKADKRQLEQVLMNLVVNARDAMPDGGAIRVVTENLILKSQMIKDRAIVPPGEYVKVTVIDEGHGIAPEKLPKIFEPFYTTKRTGEGTGLGLSTAYGIVKQTGGFIFAESEPGKGTQFSLLFPSYDLPVAPPLSVPAKGPRPISSSADGVILLVEDEAPVRAFASRALRLRGYTVLEADCAEAALELLSDPELAVDMFVTDVIMPGMDGPTWVRTALEDRPDTKVVFVSGYAEDAFGDENSQIPNAVFLPKPFSLNALSQTVQAQMQAPRLSA